MVGAPVDGPKAARAQHLHEPTVPLLSGFKVSKGFRTEIFEKLPACTTDESFKQDKIEFVKVRLHVACGQAIPDDCFWQCSG